MKRERNVETMYRVILICFCFVASFETSSGDHTIDFKFIGAYNASFEVYADGVLVANETTCYPIQYTVEIPDDYKMIAIRLVPIDSRHPALLKGFTDDDDSPLTTGTNWVSTLTPSSSVDWYRTDFDDSTWTRAVAITGIVLEAYLWGTYSIDDCQTCSDSSAAWFVSGLPVYFGGNSKVVYFRTPTPRTTTKKSTVKYTTVTGGKTTTRTTAYTSTTTRTPVAMTTVSTVTTSATARITSATTDRAKTTGASNPVMTSPAPTTKQTTTVAMTTTAVTMTPITMKTPSEPPTHYAVHARNAKVSQVFDCHLDARSRFTCAASCTRAWPRCAGFQFTATTYGDRECCLLQPQVLLYLGTQGFVGSNIWKAVPDFFELS